MEEEILEVKKLIESTKGLRLKKRLISFLDELESEQHSKQAEQRKIDNDLEQKKTISPISSTLNSGETPTLLTKPITKYSFSDETSHVFIYCTLEGCKKDSPCVKDIYFQTFSVKITIGNTVHLLAIPKLHKEIDPSGSRVTLKEGKFVVKLEKKEKGIWPKLAQEKEKFSGPKEGADGGDALQNMMKEMYQNGDDETKKMMMKAYSESMDKKAKGESVDI